MFDIKETLRSVGQSVGLIRQPTAQDPLEVVADRIEAAYGKAVDYIRKDPVRALGQGSVAVGAVGAALPFLGAGAAGVVCGSVSAGGLATYGYLRAQARVLDD